MKQFILKFLTLFFITLVMLIIGLYSVMWICVNGPSERARELFVLSVRETSAVGFLANLYLSNEQIMQIEAANRAMVDEVTDTSMITISSAPENPAPGGGLNNADGVNHAGNPNDNSNNPAEGSADNGSNNPEIKPEQPIEFHKVSGSTYKGIMMIVKDPSRVIVGTSSPVYSEDVPGKKVVDIIASYGAVAGVNAGGFEDPKGAGDGGIPKGVVISEGTLRYGDLNTTYELIGMNKDNIFVVGSMTAQKALDIGIRDAVSFGPILVVNGEATAASAGGGLNPRTAIGQRADGAMLLLVIDGRQSSSLGASYSDITKILLEYGAVNAANLDGGSSSVMYHNGELLNSCSSLYGPREMPTCIVVR